MVVSNLVDGIHFCFPIIATRHAGELRRLVVGVAGMTAPMPSGDRNGT
ncbi:MAG TPA: hypothetical protein V6D50_26470 [Chroococcales cyanobacterium]